MKTLREILLEQHRSMEGQLDALRKEVVGERVAELRTDGEVSDGGLSYSRMARKIWEELVVPCWRIWVGMGAAWLVIVAAHFAVSDSPAALQLAKAKAVPSGPEVMAALKEQKVWMAQMLEAPAPTPNGGAAISPRSERSEGTLAV